MSDDIQRRATAVRHFNRFYTRRIGVLHEHSLESAFSLTEVRILYELAHRAGLTTSDLCRELDLDPGYLSRVVTGFEKQGLIEKSRSPTDGRAMQLALTALGRQTFEPLNQASQQDVVAMLARLAAPAQQQLLDAMRRIETLLGERPHDWRLRDPRPGDMGWIVHRQAELYTEEYGWNEEYEALVAEIVAKYVRERDATCERCWIAEQDGRVAGSVFVVRLDADTAKLRLLYVDPAARGLGIGRRLVQECMQYARSVGYRRMVLWTNSVLLGARRIYEQEGFEMVEAAPHRSFGKDLVGETWARDL